MVKTGVLRLLMLILLFKRRHSHTPRPIIMPSIIKRGKPIALLLDDVSTKLKALSVPAFYLERAILGGLISDLEALLFSAKLLP